jgi:hypothetical protein
MFTRTGVGELGVRDIWKWMTTMGTGSWPLRGSRSFVAHSPACWTDCRLENLDLVLGISGDFNLRHRGGCHWGCTLPL